MANVAQFDLGTHGREARLRALLEDLVQAHINSRPGTRLALAVWHQKDANSDYQHLLELIAGDAMPGFPNDRLSLLWKTGSQTPPYADVFCTTINDFMRRVTADPGQAARYKERFEVLFFDKDLLPPELVEMFQILTEPSGLIKGWVISEEEYDSAQNVQVLLSKHSHTRPLLGLVKTTESADFEYCRGIVHVQIEKKWLPVSPEGIRPYSYYADWQRGRRVYFVFEGGSLYQVLKFEVKGAPELAHRLLRRNADDRYPEVYLRTVPVPARPAA